MNTNFGAIAFYDIPIVVACSRIFSKKVNAKSDHMCVCVC